MTSLGRRLISAVCAVTLATSLVPIPALAETPSGGGLAENEAVEKDAPQVTLTGEPYVMNMETSAGSAAISLFALDDSGMIALKPGNHSLWIDRIDVPEYALEFYKTLEEATDGDGDRDYLIEDKYFTENATREGSFSQIDLGNALTVCEIKCNSLDDMESKCIEAQKATFAALAAFDRDHPEVFWLNNQSIVSNSYSYDRNTGAGTLSIYLLLKGSALIDNEVTSIDIRADAYGDAASIKKDIDLRDVYAKNIVDKIPSGADDVEMITYFNDWLTRNNEYNTITASGGAGYKEAHECISALDGREGESGPVCEGYARAFKMLCNQVDIPCVLVDGNANGDPRQPHMWNYAQVDDAWYGVDVTWNDPPGGRDGKESGSENSDWLLLGANTKVTEQGVTFLESHPVANTVSTESPAFINGPELALEKYMPYDCSNGKHKIKEIVVDERPATCSVAGERIIKPVCELCSAEFETKAEVLEKIAHRAMKAQKTITLQPTCNKTGIAQIVIKCEMCQEVLSSNTEDIPKLAHSYGAWTTTKAATCTASGTERRVCKACGDAATRTVPARGHAFGAYRSNGDAQVNVDGTETARCSRCSATRTRTAAGSALAPTVGQTVAAAGATYQATGTATVTYAGPSNKKATSVTVPATVTISGRTYQVTSVAPKAFAGNKALKSVKIGANVKSVPANAFKGCTKLASVSFGNGITSIGKNAFSGCKALKSVTLGTKVTTIGDGAFQNCAKLTKVTVKSTKLSKIGKNAFAGCKKLGTLTLKTTKLKSIGKNAFKGTKSKLTVKVPKKKLKAYQKLCKNKGCKTIRVKK